MIRPFKTTYSKVILLLLVASISLLGLFASLYYNTLKEEKTVYTTSNIKFSEEIKLLLDLKSEIYESTVNDLSLWTDHVNFIKAKQNNKITEKDWYESNIGSITESYDIDYLATYDIKQNLIVEKYSDSFFHKINIPKTFLPNAIKKRVSKFYYQSDIGLLEIYTGTIHPTNVLYRENYDPEGVFVLINHLDNNYYKRLKAISSSNLNVIENNQTPTVKKNEVFSIVPLLDFNGGILKKLVFKRPFNLNFNNSKEILKIIIVLFLINLAIFSFFIYKYIFKPLFLTTKILEDRQHSDINKLRKQSGEFGYIGNLFLNSEKQRAELIIAKEKAEESDLLKSAFLTNLSHEIRTPMNAIIGFTNILETDTLTEKEKNEYFQIIKKSGKNLVSIIDDLIDMSKIDTAITKPKLKPFNLSESLKDVYNTVKVTIPTKKNIKLVLTPPNLPVKQALISDEVKLKQILVNLLNNAIKFTNEGSIMFGYNITSNNMLLFTVKDTGIGITEEEQKSIFSRFKRIHTDETIDVTGLGLGLSICKAYVEMLGGTISLTSIKNEGSTFFFTIPLNLDVAFKTKDTPVLKKQNTNKKPLTILVAEDDNINFMLVKRVLSKYNHNIIRAKNGEEAVEISAKSDTIDLILMDLKMPKLTGLEALKIIKPLKPKLPIIAHTAYSSQEDKVQVFEAGFTDCVTKPLDETKLLNAIDKIFYTKETLL